MIRCLMMPKDEELWVGTNNGVYIYNLLTENCTVFKRFFDSHSLSCNTVTDMYIDKEKGIWVGTLYGGLNYQSHVVPGTLRFIYRMIIRRAYKASDSWFVLGCRYAETLGGNRR